MSLIGQDKLLPIGPVSGITTSRHKWQRVPVTASGSTTGEFRKWDFKGILKLWNEHEAEYVCIITHDPVLGKVLSVYNIMSEIEWNTERTEIINWLKI